MILVISLEGIESNTEVHFYDGLGYHCNSIIECIALGHHSSKTKDDFIGRIVNAMREKSNIINKIKYVFFIADGDDQHAMEPIINSMKTARIKLLEYNKKLKFEDKLIFDKNKSFDKVILRLLGYKKVNELDEEAKKIYKIRKTGTFKRLFNEIIDYRKELWDKSDIINSLRNIKEIISFSNHSKIIEKIIEMLSNKDK